MRTRCLECRDWALPGRPRCGLHNGQREALRSLDRRLARRARLASGDGVQARMRRVVRKAGEAAYAVCGRVLPAAELEIDHRVALADGGKDVEANVRPLCRADHRVKTTEENRRRRRGG
jgi:5-methylcytosine-specific restriction endonuclease McrA